MSLRAKMTTWSTTCAFPSLSVSSMLRGVEDADAQAGKQQNEEEHKKQETNSASKWCSAAALISATTATRPPHSPAPHLAAPT